jgi:hypothetical protein
MIDHVETIWHTLKELLDNERVKADSVKIERGKK